MSELQMNSLALNDESRGLSQACEREYFPLSFAQEGVWLFEQFFPGTPTYNIPEAWRLKGQLVVEALQKSLDEIVKRHEILRTQFISQLGKAEQLVLSRAPLELQWVDLAERSRPTEELTRVLADYARFVFDLSSAPLARVTLFRLAPDEHVLLLNQHHIISDAWSQGLFMAELAACYSAFVRGETVRLTPVPVQYADFVLWQRDLLECETGRSGLAYWKQQLLNLPKSLPLPFDRHRPDRRTREGRTHFSTLPTGLVQELKELSRRQGTTIYMTLLAAFNALLHLYTGETDIVVGAPMACRDKVEVENLLGFFVHNQALRTDLSGHPGFLEVLRRVREVVLQGYAHQAVPCELALQGLPSERFSPGGSFFRVVFGWQNTPEVNWTLPGLDCQKIELDTGTAKFDWSILVSESHEGLLLRSEFSTGLFSEDTMRRLLRQFEVLLTEIVGSPDKKISDFSLLTLAERNQVLCEWNRTTTDYERNSRVHEVFEVQASKTPEATALSLDGKSMSYHDLNCRSNQLAHYLISRGVRSGANVGICLPRSFDLIVALVATLKAGAAYVPMDLDYPSERLAFIRRDAQIDVLITNTDGAEKLEANQKPGTVVVLKQENQFATQSVENPRLSGSPTDAAYIMYTSGSTGVPKGTVVPHRAVVRLVRNTSYLAFSPEWVFLQSAPITFDASTFEIWGALLNGASLVVLAPGVPSLEQLGRAIRDNRVTTLWLTAGLFDQMIEHQLDSLRGLKHLLAGGDVLSPQRVAVASRALSGCQIINGYGPTENTTFTCCFSVKGEWPEDRALPIGKPIANTRVYLLNERLAPVPVGVPGELYTAGDGLALGYLNQPELTSRKFLANPFEPGGCGRLYRTGDRARWLPDGNLEFLGRIDSQVKIRGHRVEPGEIESVLLQHASVASAVVVPREDRFLGKHLAAYVMCQDANAPSSSKLREYLAGRLPAYFVPTHIAILKSLPLTPNGKVDRNALPVPPTEHEPDGLVQVGPRNSTEKLIASIWCELFGRQDLGIQEDFFKLGGHSLIATQIISRINNTFQIDLPLLAIFEAPTVAQLAAVVDRQRSEVGTEPPIIGRSGPSRAAELLEHLEELSEAQIDQLLRDPQLKCYDVQSD